MISTNNKRDYKTFKQQSMTTNEDESKSKTKSEDVEPPTRKVRILNKRKVCFRANRKLDEYLVVRAKNAQSQESSQITEQEMNMVNQENKKLKEMLEELERDEQSFRTLAKLMLQNTIQQNIQLKSNENQSKFLHSKLAEEVYDNQSKLRLLSEDLQNPKLSVFDRSFKRREHRKSKENFKSQTLQFQRNRLLKRSHFYSSHCAFKLNQPSWAVVGQIYQPLELIFKTEWYELYKALNIDNLETVAIKLYYCKDQAMRKIAEHQYAVHSKIKHKNILQCHDLFNFSEDKVCLVYQWADYSLSDIIREINQKEALQVCKYVSEGLLHLRSKQIVHRKIKVENIMFKNGMPKISDFCLAVEGLFTKQSQTEKSALKGKQFPPEYLYSRATTQKFDLWSLGILLFQSLFKIDAGTMTVQQIKEKCKLYEGLESYRSILNKLLSDYNQRPMIEAFIKELKTIDTL